MTYRTRAHGSTYHQHIGQRFPFCTRPCEKHYIDQLVKYFNRQIRSWSESLHLQADPEAPGQ